MNDMNTGTEVSTFGNSEFTEEEIQKVQALLSEKLGKDIVLFRPGPSSEIVPYVTLPALIDIANEMFGHNGWSSEVRSIQQDFIELVDGKYRAGCSALVRVILKDGSYREDIGYGICHGDKQMHLAIEISKKTAVSNALKRTLRLFGSNLGNCLSEKTHVESLKQNNARYKKVQAMSM